MTASNHGQLAVVTGASSGIGREIARALARDGHPVLAVARRTDRLEALAAEANRSGWAPIHPLAQDVTVPAGVDAVAEGARALGGAGWLVNCAGVAAIGPFAEADAAELARVIALSVAAPVLLTRALLPQLLASRDGHVLNVSSLAALQPCPWFATYGGSKAFSVSFSEALAEELRGRVAVTVCCPGPVRTEIFEASAPGLERRATFYDLDASTVARAAISAARAARVVHVPGMINRLVALSTRLVPRSILRRVSRTVAIRYIGYAPPKR